MCLCHSLHYPVNEFEEFLPTDNENAIPDDSGNVLSFYIIEIKIFYSQTFRSQ